MATTAEPYFLVCLQFPNLLESRPFFFAEISLPFLLKLLAVLALLSFELRKLCFVFLA